MCEHRPSAFSTQPSNHASKFFQSIHISLCPYKVLPSQQYGPQKPTISSSCSIIPSKLKSPAKPKRLAWPPCIWLPFTSTVPGPPPSRGKQCRNRTWVRTRSSKSWTRARMCNAHILHMTSSHLLWSRTEARLSILCPTRNLVLPRATISGGTHDVVSRNANT